MSTSLQEIKLGRRFQFGKNWGAFVKNLSSGQIRQAENSLKKMLSDNYLDGSSFLDFGSGSGLSSLAAKNLGADTVLSIDYDLESVNCTKKLKEKYYPKDNSWAIESASVLDHGYIDKLGKFDVVYSWGVLHHTGDMWSAFSNVLIPLKENGLLFIAIYNDQQFISAFWKLIKKLYCNNPITRFLILVIFIPLFLIVELIVSTIKYKNPFLKMILYKKNRGMSIYYDWIDWLGGYPFEVAKPEEVLNYYNSKGLKLINMTTTNGSGCNQFIFEKISK